MKKLRSRRGMTFMELLCSVVILLLASALIAVGARFCVKTYKDSITLSQAQTLCSTVTTAISDKLRYCGTVTQDSEGGVTQIFIQNVGSVEGDEQKEAFGLNDSGQVMLGSSKLLSTAAYPEGLKVANLTLDYDGTSRVFTISFQIENSGGETLAETEFQVLRINLDTA